jgi:hypothetical protein
MLKSFPTEHLQSLREGKKLVLKVTPLNPKYKPVALAFDPLHIYEVKVLPTQSWIHDIPIFDVEDNLPAEVLLRRVMRAVLMMANLVDGARIEFAIAQLDVAKEN